MPKAKACAYIHRTLKIIVGFAWKTDNDIRCQVKLRVSPLQLFRYVFKFCRCVLSAHGQKNSFRTGLQAEMDMRRHLRVSH